MTISEFIDFCKENFDENQRKTMEVSIVYDRDRPGQMEEPIDPFDVKCGVRGVDIHVQDWTY